MSCHDDGVSQEPAKAVVQPEDIQLGLQEITEVYIRDSLTALERQATHLKGIPNSGEKARQLSLVRTNLQQALLWLDAMDVLS